MSDRALALLLGEAIPIYAEIENCSSRLIVPKAAIFQTQTYLARGRTKTVRYMVANVRGNHIASGSTDTWNGKTLKIPPVSPSILDCCIIRVDYSLAVSWLGPEQIHSSVCKDHFPQGRDQKLQAP